MVAEFLITIGLVPSNPNNLVFTLFAFAFVFNVRACQSNSGQALAYYNYNYRQTVAPCSKTRLDADFCRLNSRCVAA
ncbi:hypothetical protein N431DRAFT_48571 [Stipitochalara longipes BDJ]|nr:hypothetical protein N431DRAFT_48571 [Stipitochalara longipes BDJ]